MRTIYKYPLEITRRQEIATFRNCRVIHVGEQSGQLILWLLVDTKAEWIDLPVFVFGTGHPLPDAEFHHVGTVCMSDGFVWHVFLEPLQ